MSDGEGASETLTKVPAVTLGFWIIKILATTLGETGGDTVTMTWLGETTPHPMPYGYLIGTLIFGALLVGLSSRRSRRARLIRGFTGQRLWLRPLVERPSPTSRTGRLGLAIRVVRSCCSHVFCYPFLRGTAPWVRLT